jgi:hypothetical protein
MKIENISSYSDCEIEALKICDLSLELPECYQAQVEKLERQLKTKGILWRPYFWLADEWFSPDGVPGIAIPFFLCHPRLQKLSTKYLGSCEGKTLAEFYKLICHETGHAIDNAYQLRKKKRRQKLFGLTSTTYPKSYTPRSDSTDYVTHLEDFYAQAHPDEDWAETFAVWLNEKRRNKIYHGTKAEIKLNYLDEVMQNLKSGQEKTSKEKPLHYKKDDRTIKEFFLERRQELKLNKNNYYDKVIMNDFSKKKHATNAFNYINKIQKEIIQNIEKKSAKDSWVIEKCLNDIKRECKKENYSLKYSNKKTKQVLLNHINLHIDDFVKKGNTQVIM